MMVLSWCLRTFLLLSIWTPRFSEPCAGRILRIGRMSRGRSHLSLWIQQRPRIHSMRTFDGRRPRGACATLVSRAACFADRPRRQRVGLSMPPGRGRGGGGACGGAAAGVESGAGKRTAGLRGRPAVAEGVSPARNRLRRGGGGKPRNRRGRARRSRRRCWARARRESAPRHPPRCRQWRRPS